MIKARENRLRRAAERQGLVLRKSRTRDELALNYGWYISRGADELIHLKTLDDVQEWLANPAGRKQGR